jgi:hypothetical protein
LGAGLILFTAKFDTPLIIKSLAFYYRGKLAVAEVRGAESNTKLLEEFDLKGKKMPVLIGICGGNEKLAYELFSGDIKKFKEIEEFVDQFKDKKYCTQLTSKALQEKKDRAKKAKEVHSLSIEQLQKKKISELKDMIKYLGISSTGLFEKADYVRVIIEARPSSQSSSDFFDEDVNDTKSDPDTVEAIVRYLTDNISISFLQQKQLSELLSYAKRFGLTVIDRFQKSDFIRVIKESLSYEKLKSKKLSDLIEMAKHLGLSVADIYEKAGQQIKNFMEQGESTTNSKSHSNWRRSEREF